MSFLVVCVFAVVAALIYFVATPPPAPPSTKWAELARLTYHAAIFAIMFALALGTHDVMLRVVK